MRCLKIELGRFVEAAAVRFRYQGENHCLDPSFSHLCLSASLKIKVEVVKATLPPRRQRTSVDRFVR